VLCLRITEKGVNVGSTRRQSKNGVEARNQDTSKTENSSKTTMKSETHSDRLNLNFSSAHSVLRLRRDDEGDEMMGVEKKEMAVGERMGAL